MTRLMVRQNIFFFKTEYAQLWPCRLYFPRGSHPNNSAAGDDNIKNVHASNTVGLQAIHFQSSEKLAEELKIRGVIV